MISRTIIKIPCPHNPKINLLIKKVGDSLIKEYSVCSNCANMIEKFADKIIPIEAKQ